MAGRVVTVVAALGALAVGAGVAWWLGTPPAPEPVSAPAGVDAVPERRPDFALRDLSGELRRASEWDGEVLVVNFWATWCPPCRKEIPVFIELQERLGPAGLQFVGIAIDEREAVREYADTMGVNYPVLAGEVDAIEVSRAYGNAFGALPYTAVVDREGRIVFVKRGELSRAEVEAVIAPLL